MQPSAYGCIDGLGRSDLASLTLARYPSIFIEMGNMTYADDAAVSALQAAAVTPGIRHVPVAHSDTRATPARPA